MMTRYQDFKRAIIFLKDDFKFLNNNNLAKPVELLLWFQKTNVKRWPFIYCPTTVMTPEDKTTINFGYYCPQRISICSRALVSSNLILSKPAICGKEFRLPYG